MTLRSSKPAPDHSDFDDDEGLDASSLEIQKERLKQLILGLLVRWHWIALGAILGALGGFYYLSKAPKTYEAASTILVKQSTGSVLSSSKDQENELELRSVEALNTVAQRVKRPELLRQVAAAPEIRELPGLIPEPVDWLPAWAAKWFGREVVPAEDADSAAIPPAETLWKALDSWTKVAARRNTRLLDVTVSHPSPKVAQALASAIATEFNRELTSSRAQGRTSSFEILVKESENTRLKLQKAQNALANYQSVLVTLKDLEDRERTAMELSRRYRPKHPRLAAARNELNVFQARFLSEFNSVRAAEADKDYWESVRVEWEVVRLQEVNEQVQTARRLLVARSNVLGNEIESQTSVFNSMLTRMQETDVNQQSAESEIEVDRLAELPTSPSSPKVPLILGAATLAGLGGGLALALLLYRLDTKFHSVPQIEFETSLPVLAGISEIPLKALQLVIRKKRIQAANPSSGRDRWNARLLFRDGISETMYAEMFRVLRASVSLLGDEKARKVTLFTSSIPGEGKTMVSTNFALAAAQTGKKTLLIDLDLRKPTIHKIFGLGKDLHSAGATELLAGQATFAEAIYTDSGQENLHLILSGRRAPNPGELLNAEGLTALLDRARQEYEVIVIDSAPLLAVPDTRVIAPLADNLCLVIRAETVPKSAVRAVLELLAGDKTKISGAVVNGIAGGGKPFGRKYTYGRYGKQGGYGYGSYGTYGTYGVYGADEKE